VFIIVYTSGSSFIFQCEQAIEESESRGTLSGRQVARNPSDDEPTDASNNGEGGDTRSVSSIAEDAEEEDADDENDDDENDDGQDAPDADEHSSNNSDKDEDDTNIREENHNVPPVIDNSQHSQQRQRENRDGSRSSCANADVGMQPRVLGHVRSNGAAPDIGDLRHKLFACINAGSISDRTGQISGNEGGNGNQIGNQQVS
jgi:hypothetical protein